jgi:zinc/manganese transport system ATP-binding protein
MNEEHKPKATSAPPAIIFEDAGVSRSGKIIWSQGTFEIPSGTITAIVGTNGAGKTTMLNIELGLLPLGAGSVKVLGGEPGTVNQRIGYVPQIYAAEADTNITSAQSVELGLIGTRYGIHHGPLFSKTQIRAKVSHALEVTGISDKANVRISQLSGGLRQRVAIAQALVSDPDLLLLDEPLANLDIASQRSVVEVLAHLNASTGMTIQIVAHDINMLLPVLTGAVYLLDGHPHYSAISNVLDSHLLTHLYGTKVEVVKTPQGDMFVRPDADIEPDGRHLHTHTPDEVVAFHSQAADNPQAIENYQNREQRPWWSLVRKRNTQQTKHIANERGEK